MPRAKKRAQKSKNKRALSTRQETRLVALIAGLVLVCVGVNGVRSWYKVRHGGIPTGHRVETTSTDRPSEQPVPGTYSVPADKPLSIQLPSIKSKGFIQQVGVDKKNQMVVPSNVHMAGWYTGSTLPGDPGLSIIDGHVNGLYAKGIFKDLVKLKAGDKFTVTFGDKTKRNFQVKKLKTVSVEEANTVLYERDSSVVKQLNLITCTGRYEKSDHSYDQRVIVFSEGA